MDALDYALRDPNCIVGALKCAAYSTRRLTNADYAWLGGKERAHLALAEIP